MQYMSLVEYNTPRQKHIGYSADAQYMHQPPLDWVAVTCGQCIILQLLPDPGAILNAHEIMTATKPTAQPQSCACIILINRPISINPEGQTSQAPCCDVAA